jgi:hypothetical protein
LPKSVHRFCAWSGAYSTVLMLLGFVIIARFVPTPSPDASAIEIAERFRDDATQIRWGMIITGFGAAFIGVFGASISMQMRRIEGRSPLLASIMLGMSMVFMFEFIYSAFFWLACTFRGDRAPELVLLINDVAWIPFVGISSTVIAMALVLGVAVLFDRGPHPVFPRWFGYYNLWCATLFTPGSFNVFFKTGPLAWNGVFAFYIPLAVFASWLLITSYLLSRAVNDQFEEDAKQPVTHPTAAEFARMRAELDQLLPRQDPHGN